MGTVDVFLALLRCAVLACVCKYAAHALVKQKLKISKNVDYVEFSFVNSTFQTTSIVRCGVICFDYASFYYVNSTRTCHCNTKMVCQANSSTSTDIVLIQMALEELIVPLQATYRHCLDIYDHCVRKDGVYKISPTNGLSGVNVFCDMSNGGWTIIQRRLNGEVDFYRNWDSYRSGFGTKSGEYWLGLEFIHMLTLARSQLLIEMETFGDVVPLSAFALYDFSIGDEFSFYKLNVSYIHSNCNDSLSIHNGMPFSTFDANHGDGSLNCPEIYTGAWWYTSCHKSNLNGRYDIGHNSQFGKGINWSTCWGYYYSLQSTTMKIKRLIP